MYNGGCNDAGSVTPPPGLGAFDEMMPLKVELPSGLKPCHITQVVSLDAATAPTALPTTKDNLEPLYAAQFQSREWTANLAAQLSSQGMHQSFAMADQANPGAFPYLPYAPACAMWQAQLQKQQQLFAELQMLTVDAALRDTCQPSRSDPKSPETSLLKTKAASDKAKAPLPTAAATAATAAASRKVQTLSTSLQLLSGEDPDCLFIVRRINKLGFKAVRTLKQHFSAQGPVVKVLLAHSTVRQHGDPACHARRRPSSLGFVHMGTAEAACKVLALGAEQEVDGVMIRVQRFERQRDMDEELDDDEECKLSLECKMDRGSEESVSTAASPMSSPELSHIATLPQVSDMDEDRDSDF